MIEPDKLPWSPDFNQLSQLIIELVNMDDLPSASYVIGILQTDLAEQGHKPTRKNWPIPGEAAPTGWEVYDAVLRWLMNGYG